MVFNTKSTSKISENLTGVIPKIISKEVQLLYCAFGTHGVKNLNFSKTTTFKYLLGTYNNFDSSSSSSPLPSLPTIWGRPKQF
jgi:hypothetical protein